MAVRAHLFKIGGRVLGGMQLGLLVFWDAVWGAVWFSRDWRLGAWGVLFGVLVLGCCWRCLSWRWCAIIAIWGVCWCNLTITVDTEHVKEYSD